MKIKVLEIIGDSSLAGAPRHFLGILENIDTDKFKVHAICPPGPLAGEIRKLSRHIELDLIAMPSRFSITAIIKIRKEIRHLKPEIIHVHGTRAGILGRVAAIGFNFPVIYTEHLWTNEFKLKNPVLNFFHYFANWFLDLFTNLNIAVSQAVKDFLVNSKISRAEKVKVIYNGIFPSKKKANVFSSDEEFLIASVGTLNEQKGMQFLIKAMAIIVKEFPQTRLEIIGDGPYKRTLTNLVKKKKLTKNVKFVGFVKDVEDYLLKFDLYVQPSLSESFGLAITQAMSAGLPVVASFAGGIPEVVTQGKTGYLVEPSNHKALSEAILDLLRNKSQAQKMGKLAKEDVDLKFNHNDMMKELENTYVEVAKSPAFLE